METMVVKFQKDNLVCVVDENNVPHVAVANICEAIGINLKKAKESIQNHPILGPEGTIQTLQVIGSDQKRDYFCLPLHFINGWLFSISSNKVKPEAREKLITYQKECYKVLFEYFFGKTKNIVNRVKRQHYISERLKEVNRIINKMMLEHRALTKEHKQLSISNYIDLELPFSEPQFNEDNLTGFLAKQITMNDSSVN
jgi:hypothetical protein